MWVWRWVKSYGNNFGRVTTTIWRSAQPNPNKLRSYRDDYGIEAILNLRDDADEKERAGAESLGLAYWAVPMADDAIPEARQVTGIINTLRSGIPMLIHCKGGRHRTGLAVACYRVREQGWSKEEAWREAERYGYYSAFGHGPLKEWFWDAFDGKQ